MNKIDTTDTDGDGLYDVYETAGMKIANGTVMYSFVSIADSDNDGLMDGEEITPRHDLNNMPIWREIAIKSKLGEMVVKHIYFDYKSDPKKNDTDGDKIDDLLDKKPRKKETIEILFPLYEENVHTNAIYIDVKENIVNIIANIRFTGDANEIFPGTNKIYAEVAVEGIERKWKIDTILGTDYDFVPGLKGELKTTIFYEVPGKSYIHIPDQEFLEINITKYDPYEIVKDRRVPHWTSGKDGWKIGEHGIIKMYEKDSRGDEKYTKTEYESTVAHEFGHALGVGDAYPEANKDKILVSNDEISGGKFAVSGSIMYCNGEVYVNDIEMVLEAFRTNQYQYAMSHPEEGETKSRVIRLPQYFSKKE